jgi:hypothetical protein
MTLTYLVTNGFETQVQPSSISNLNLTFEKGANSIFVYGSNPATTDEIREGYKMYMYSGDSLISLADIKNYILNIQKLVPGIKKCLVIDSTLDTSFGKGSAELDPGCFGVFVLKDNNTPLTEDEGGELSLLQEDIDAKKPAGTVAIIGNPTKQPIRIELNPLPSEEADVNFIKSIIIEYVNNKEIGGSLSAGEIFELIFSARPKLYNKGLVVELLEEPPVTTYLTFQSDSSFTLKVNNNTKNWDGTLYYSTDLETWSEWDGTTILNSANNKLYLRGKGNKVITGSDNQNYRWVLTGSNIKCIGNIENLLDWEAVESGNHPSMESYCYAHLFRDCAALVSAPALPATTLADYCYYYMFSGCTALASAPVLPATTLASGCYQRMFYGCTSLKISSTKTGDYQYEWRIPAAPRWNTRMFSGTGGTFTDDPTIDITYYVENPPVPEPNATYLTFQSDSSFSLRVNDSTKHWNGTLYYSTDLETWHEWDGTTITSSIDNKLYLRGKENTVITGNNINYGWVFTGSNIECTGNIENLLDWEVVESGNHPPMAPHCYAHLFRSCTNLVSVPALPATTLARGCYQYMFRDCTSLKVSSDQIGDYQYEWKIPAVSSWNTSMLSETGGTFTDNPTIDITYYVENPPVVAPSTTGFPSGYYYVAYNDIDSETVELTHIYFRTSIQASESQEFNIVTLIYCNHSTDDPEDLSADYTGGANQPDSNPFTAEGVNARILAQIKPAPQFMTKDDPDNVAPDSISKLQLMIEL